MPELEILLQTPDAKSLATEVVPELSALGPVEVRPVSTAARGVDLAECVIHTVLPLLGGIADVVAIAEVLWRVIAHFQRCPRGVSGVIRVKVGKTDARIELCDATLDKLVKLLQAFQ